MALHVNTCKSLFSPSIWKSCPSLQIRMSKHDARSLARLLGATSMDHANGNYNTDKENQTNSRDLFHATITGYDVAFPRGRPSVTDPQLTNRTDQSVSLFGLYSAALSSGTILNIAHHQSIAYIFMTHNTHCLS